jgi:hypothetical protein
MLNGLDISLPFSLHERLRRVRSRAALAVEWPSGSKQDRKIRLPLL